MASENLAPDDLVTQLLLARGVARDDLDRQRTPTLRGSPMRSRPAKR